MGLVGYEFKLDVDITPDKSVKHFYSGIEWRPHAYLDISKDESDSVIKTLETLEEDDDVQNTFVNCNIHI